MTTTSRKILDFRSKLSPRELACACCSSYQLPNGAFQADSNLEACKSMAIDLGTNRVRMAVKPEAYLAGEDGAEMVFNGSSWQVVL